MFFEISYEFLTTNIFMSRHDDICLIKRSNCQNYMTSLFSINECFYYSHRTDLFYQYFMGYLNNFLNIRKYA